MGGRGGGGGGEAVRVMELGVHAAGAPGLGGGGRRGGQQAESRLLLLLLLHASVGRGGWWGAEGGHVHQAFSALASLRTQSLLRVGGHGDLEGGRREAGVWGEEWEELSR